MDINLIVIPIYKGDHREKANIISPSYRKFGHELVKWYEICMQHMGVARELNQLSPQVSHYMIFSC